MNQMPVGRQTLVAGILAHGRNENAVAKSEFAKLDVLKEIRLSHAENASLSGLDAAPSKSIGDEVTATREPEFV